MKNWKLLAAVAAIVIGINLVAFFWARSASAQAAPATGDDGGPTGRART